MVASIDVRHAYWNIRYWRPRLLWQLLRTLRIADCFKCLWLFPLRWPGRPAVTVLRLRGGPALTLRTYSSDPDVFRQVFLDRQYELPIQLPRVTRVVDAGANIGLSSVFFLMRHPTARVIALEPDRSNYDLAVLNTESFGTRCRILPLALWSDAAPLALIKGDAAWSTHVSEIGQSDETVQGITLAQVLKDADWLNADIIKMDIEGAETQVLARETPATVSAARCWAVELHNDAARESFSSLFDKSRWRISRRGEVDFACTPKGA